MHDDAKKKTFKNRKDQTPSQHKPKILKLLANK